MLLPSPPQSILKTVIFPFHCCRKQTLVYREFGMEAQFPLHAGPGFTDGASESPGLVATEGPLGLG